MLNLSDFFEKLKIEEGIGDGTLALFPVFGSDLEEEFLLLEEAMEMKGFRIREVSEFGEVPQIVVENGLDKRVLILEGEELKGAKQNRMVNITVYLEEKNKHFIPVACVEAGRWNYRKRHFEVTDHFAHPRLRGRKIESLLEAPPEARDFQADQMLVWYEVDRKLAAMKVNSPTRSLSEAFEERKEALEKIKKSLKPQKGQVGVIAAIGGKIVAFDFLASEEKFFKLFEKLLSGYALDALEVKKGARVSKRKAQNFLRNLSAIEDFTLKKSVSLGQNIFFRSKGFVAQGLILNDKVLHLSAFTSMEDRGSRKFRDLIPY